MKHGNPFYPLANKKDRDKLAANDFAFTKLAAIRFGYALMSPRPKAAPTVFTTEGEFQ